MRAPLRAAAATKLGPFESNGGRRKRAKDGHSIERAAPRGPREVADLVARRASRVLIGMPRIIQRSLNLL
jgi:hypothetical protein